MKFLKYIIAATFLLFAGKAAAQSFELELDYRLDVSGTHVYGSAAITLQDGAYVFSGESLKVFCDGKDVWTLDLVAKEVYIESLSEGDRSYLSEVFGLIENDLKDGSLDSSDFTAKDGTVVRVDLISMKKSDRKDISFFRPTETADSSWVVTDLR